MHGVLLNKALWQISFSYGPFTTMLALHEETCVTVGTRVFLLADSKCDNWQWHLRGWRYMRHNSLSSPSHRSPEDNLTAKWQHFRNQDGGLLLLSYPIITPELLPRGEKQILFIFLLNMHTRIHKPQNFWHTKEDHHLFHCSCDRKATTKEKVQLRVFRHQNYRNSRSRSVSETDKSSKFVKQTWLPTRSFSWLMCVFSLLISDYPEWII